MRFSALGGREATTFTENVVEKLPPNPVKVVEKLSLQGWLLKIWSKSFHSIQKCG